MAEPAQNRKYTYSDYLTWDDENRYELIDGEVYMMSAPSLDHQEISMEISRQLANYLQGKTCKVFPAPCDVRLNADTEDDTVVQPDMIVVCDPKKIENRKSCKGAPDMVVEILSPSTAIYDQNTKLEKYVRAGVKEYWLVNPETKSVHVYLFKNGEGIFRMYKDADVISVNILENCQIHLADVFPAVSSEEETRRKESKRNTYPGS